MEKEQKRPREREANWNPAEKEFLRKCVNMHLDIVEHKGNDTSMVLKKKKAWKAIRDTMYTAGYDREIVKLKSQWVRMKVRARKAIAIMELASVATDNSADIFEISAEDNLVRSMIKHDFDEDGILIEADCVNTCVESPQSEEFLLSESVNGRTNSEKDFHVNFDKSSTTDEQCFVDSGRKNKQEYSPTATPLKCLDKISTTKKQTSSSKRQRIRKIPKTLFKNRVILERQRQIAKESLHFEEVKKLQIKQLNAEIEHMERMHKMQEAHEKDLQSLKVQQLQRQIRQDEELHVLKLDIIRKKAASNDVFY